MKETFRNFAGIIKEYQWKSLFFVYLKQLLIIILIPVIILFSVTFTYKMNMLNKNFSSLQKTSLEKNSSLINGITENIDNVYNLVFSNSQSKAFFLTDLKSTRSFELNNITKKAVNTFDTYMQMYPYIKSIYIYNLKSDYVASDLYIGKAQDFIDNAWYKIYKETGSCYFIYPTEYTYFDEKISQISFSYPIKYETDLEGILVINLDISALDNLLAGTSEEENFIIYEDLIIYSTNHSYIGTKANDNSDIKEIFENKNSSDSQIKINNTWINVKKAESDLTVISKLRSESFMKSYGSMLFSYALILAFILLLAVLYSMYNAYKFYSYIADIIVQFPEFGTIPDIASEKKENELASIKNNLIAMINKTENIEKMLSEKMAALKVAQTFALQSQINPHFIFNTLNLINLTIIDSEGIDHKAVGIIDIFSKMISKIFSSNNYLISVREELDYAKKFLEIERIKTDNSFTIDWNIDKNIYGKKTLKMILQPIIENAVEHGIKPRFDKNGKLKVEAFCENGKTIFIISDNGVGISSDKQKELEEKMKNLDIAECKHLGIKNVHTRINILYGSDYGVKIHSSEALGTTIIITQPEEKFK